MTNTLTLDDILYAVKEFFVRHLDIKETWRTQDNRVAMSKGLCAYLTPLFFKRLTTTRSTYHDTGTTGTGELVKSEVRTLDIQVDIYGEGSVDKAIALETLFRDEYSVMAFHEINPAITPLYSNNVNQNVFYTDPKQYLDRYTVTLTFQTDIGISVPMAFFTQAELERSQPVNEAI